MNHDIQVFLSITYPVRSSGYVMDKISWYDLYQCFPAKYSRNLRIPRKIVEQININSEIPQKISKCLWKYRGNFCPAIGNTGIISVHYQLSLLFLLFWFVFNVTRSCAVPVFVSYRYRSATPIATTRQAPMGKTAARLSTDILSRQ